MRVLRSGSYSQLTAVRPVGARAVGCRRVQREAAMPRPKGGGGGGAAAAAATNHPSKRFGFTRRTEEKFVRRNVLVHQKIVPLLQQRAKAASKFN